jgi:cytochrome c-type biogenesis protein CcmE
MNLRKPKYIISLTFIALGIGIVVATSLPKSFQYYLTVNELKAREREFIGKELKVAGKVEAGSVEHTQGTIDHRFRVINEGKQVLVSFRGALPDTFKEGADVVVTGKLAEAGHIQATDVLAKCASKYEGKLTPGYEKPSKGGT